MWEVDPDTRSKLLVIQKQKGNDRCCDCGAPSPQWASPKFGTFICLTCAGTHRGLGVHISFVRSISMDAFKTNEIARMEKGGNDPWKRFFDNHETTKSEGRTFEECTISERYSGEVGEEYKERLSAAVEGKKYVKGERKRTETPKYGSRSGTPVGGPRKGAGRGTPRSESPAKGQGMLPGRKEKNEAYFAKLGNENASRPDDMPPSQGGKYGGFGSEPPPTAKSEEKGIPSTDEFQKDPVAALTKGFGWFTATVGKGAKSVNESYLQPAAKTIAESDLAAQARVTAAQVGQNLQTGAKGAAESFNRFVEGQDGGPGASKAAFEPERKDFWDSFGAAAPAVSAPTAKPGAIGTAAMKKGGSGYGGTGSSATGKGKEEGWGDDW